jgi:hypothetical protein
MSLVANAAKGAPTPAPRVQKSRTAAKSSANPLGVAKSLMNPFISRL